MKISVLACMFLVMFTAKIFGVAALSWWIVTAPLWGPFVVAFLLLLVIMAIKGSDGVDVVIETLEERFNKTR